MIEEQKKWYAARTRDKQELSIRNRLKEMGVEYFLPTRQEVRELKSRRKTVEVPYIRNLIFVYATKQEAIDLPNKFGVSIFYIPDRVKKGMLIVPEKQMNDFIQVMNFASDNVNFDIDELMPGDKVRITKGELCGIEGQIATNLNNTFVIIQINGVLKASVKVLKSWLKVIGKYSLIIVYKF